MQHGEPKLTQRYGENKVLLSLSPPLPCVQSQREGVGNSLPISLLLSYLLLWLVLMIVAGGGGVILLFQIISLCDCVFKCADVFFRV